MADVLSPQQKAQATTAILNGLKEQSMDNWMLRVMAGDYGHVNSMFNAWKESGNQGAPFIRAIGPVDSHKIDTSISETNQAPFVCFLGNVGSQSYYDRITLITLSVRDTGEWYNLNSSQWAYNKDKRLLVVGFSALDISSSLYTNDNGENVLKLAVRLINDAGTYPVIEMATEVKVYTGGIV